MNLADVLPPSAALVPVRAATVEDALAELAAFTAMVHHLEAAAALATLRRREALGTTAVGEGIAIPHGRIDIPRSRGLLGISRAGVQWNAPDGMPVQVIVALLSPLTGSEHLVALAAIGRRLRDPSLRARLIALPDARQARALFVGDARER